MPVQQIPRDDSGGSSDSQSGNGSDTGNQPSDTNDHPSTPSDNGGGNTDNGGGTTDNGGSDTHKQSGNDACKNGHWIDGSCIKNGTISVPNQKPENVPKPTGPNHLTIWQVLADIKKRTEELLRNASQNGPEAAHNFACSQANLWKDRFPDLPGMLNCT
ncbi:hypothetical protein [Streptomyces sp. NPDC048385]